MKSTVTDPFSPLSGSNLTGLCGFLCWSVLQQDILEAKPTTGET